MKQKLLNSLRLQLCMLVALFTTAFAGQAWGEVKTITLDSKSSYSPALPTASGSVNSTATAHSAEGLAFKEAGLYINSNGYIMFAENKGYLYNTASLGTIKSVALTYTNGCSTNAKAGLYFGNEEQSTRTTTSNKTVSANGKTDTWENSTDGYGYFQISTSNKNCQILKIVITYDDGGSTTETCATPTFSPAAGAVASGTKVSISSTEGATIYYTTDGSNPTSSSYVYQEPIEITEATTIKAYAVKSDYDDSSIAEAAYTIKQVVNGYTIDFESDLEDYTDWTITNLTKTNETITGHNSSAYFAKTNQTTTAVVQTKVPIENPGTFTCYISKIGTNTNATSYWKVQVSEDATNWTDVKSAAAASGVTAGTWTEITADLESYSNVYVRLYYTGSTAVRTVDDISLTMRDINAKPKPTVAISGDLTLDLDGETNVNAGMLIATVTYEDAAIEGATVAWSSSNVNVATIDENTGVVTIKATGEVTFTATFAATESYAEATATKTVTVIDSNVPGASKENPYTVAQAIAAIDAANKGTIENVYVKGIVSKVDGYYSSKYITYWISDDGVTTNQFEVYNGLGIDGANFSSKDDVQVGDVVVVSGNITYYTKGNVYEFAQNNKLVSLTRKEPATITVEGGTEFTIDRNANESTLTFTATANSGATVVYTVDTENTTIAVSGYALNGNELTVSSSKGGVIVIKANAEAAGEYKAATEVTITVTVVGQKEDAIIVVNEKENVAYGSTFTVDTEAIEGGDISVSSSNTQVATVSGLTITPVAVGTTTITVATAENAEYKAGSETFELTVTAPEGLSTAKPAIYTSTFKDKQLSIEEEDGFAWTCSSTEAANSMDNQNGRGLGFGAAKGQFTLTATNSETVTKVSLVLSTNESDNTVAVKVGETAFTYDDAENHTLTSGDKNKVVDFVGNGTGDIVISINDTKKTVWVKSITIYAGAAKMPATLNAKGLGTFASQYPIDFSDDSEVSAWQITDITEAEGVVTLTFDQVTGDVVGGTGVLLKGEGEKAGQTGTVTLTSKDSETELSDNLLTGTLAPTYVEAGQYWGLSGESFKKINEGVVKAGKAILANEWIEVASTSTDIKAFRLVFNNDVTGLQTIETLTPAEAAEIFDLSGRRIAKMQKGVNIVGGKKVVVK